VLGAEAGAGDLDEVGAVGKAVERRRGEERLAEEVGPLRTVAIRGHDDGALLVPLVDDVVEVLGPGRAQRAKPEVAQDEQIGAGVAGEPLLVRAVGVPAGEVGERLGGVDEEDVVAAPARLVGQGLAEVALGDAGRAVDQDVFAARDELAGGEVEDLRSNVIAQRCCAFVQTRSTDRRDDSAAPNGSRTAHTRQAVDVGVASCWL
jgi:hypothetical protein